jgi:hypothetical protein
MTDPKSDRAALDRLADALAEDILNASDQAILAEVKEDGEDPAAIAAEIQALFAKAKVRVAKRHLAEAKAGAAAASRGRPVNVVRLDPAKERKILERALNHDPELGAKLTHAARKAEALSDNDVHGMLEDLAELGISLPSPDQEP